MSVRGAVTAVQQCGLERTLAAEVISGIIVALDSSEP